MLYIFGDTHANWKGVNSTVNKIVQSTRENIDIIIVGDFGYWPNEKAFSLGNLKIFNGRVKYYFCPGNHEHWWELNNLVVPESKILEVHENVFYCSFGAVKKFLGKTYLFCGGADSIDKNQRVIGIDWFPEEVITISDMYNLPPDDKKIDIIISHTCPTFAIQYLGLTNTHNYKDPSCDMLSQVYDIFKPKQWYFGHFHMFKQFNYNETQFTCLNYVSSNGVYYLKF